MSEEEVLLQLLPGELSESSSQCATSCASVTDRRKFGPQEGGWQEAPRTAPQLSPPQPRTNDREHRNRMFIYLDDSQCWVNSVDPLLLISSAAAQLGTYF